MDDDDTQVEQLLEEHEHELKEEEQQLRILELVVEDKDVEHDELDELEDI